MEQNQGLIFKSIVAIMRDVEAIGKGRQNTQQNYKFRGIDDAYNSLHPLFAKHGVFSTPEVLEAKDDSVQTRNGGVLFYARLVIRYTFYAEDGSSVSTTVRGEGMDSGDKASNKAMAVAHKYALLQLLQVPTEDPKDPENESPAPVSAPAKAAPAKSEPAKSEPAKAEPVKQEKSSEIIADCERFAAMISGEKRLDAREKIDEWVKGGKEGLLTVAEFRTNVLKLRGELRAEAESKPAPTAEEGAAQ